MLKRTTHYEFSPYGAVYYELPELKTHIPTTTYHKVSSKFKNKSVSQVYHCSAPVFVDCKSGIVLMEISKDGKEFERFVIHRIVEIKAGMYFGFISISNESTLEAYIPEESPVVCPLKNEITYQPIETKLHIEEILATYYQVRKGSYVFPGEAHEYYELIYIDHGSIETSIEDTEYPLSKYDLMIYAPGQFHSHHTREDQNCAYLTVVFRMNDALPETLTNRVFHSRKDIYQVLCRFMKAVQDDSYLNQELAILYLKEIIILLHQFDHKESVDASASPMQIHYEHTLLNEILVFINNNLYSSFTVEDICTKFSVSRSSLQNLFRNNLHISPKQYISNRKLSQAKQLIQQHTYTISEISDMLGFTSIHYFSRKFKTAYGLSPTDYSKSINQ